MTRIHQNCAPAEPEYVYAQFMMPVEVDWSRNDMSLLTRFWEGAGQKDREMAAEIADRVLVYHRGFDKVHSKP